MKKMVVLGCAGMAGHVLTEYMTNKGEYQVFGVARASGPFVTHVLDVTDFFELKNILLDIKPDYVVNCIGMLVSKSADDICAAILINSYLPNYLSGLGRELDFKLIHISTDCVFSGKTGDYDESSFRDGDDNYARTKALGEINNEQDLTIRTSIIGPELKSNGTSLLDWFLKQSGQIKGFTNAYWSGVSTLELAKAIDEFIKQDIKGLFQLCPEKKISKYDLLRSFSKAWHKDIVVSQDDSYHIDKSLVSTRNDFNYSVPEYSVMLEELHDWMNARVENYKHYKF